MQSGTGCLGIFRYGFTGQRIRQFTAMRLARLLCALLIPIATSPLMAGDLSGFCRSKKLDCSELTSAIASIRANGRLPDKFITKKEAKELGWHPGSDLTRVAPGKSIGGDKFGNFEKRLPVKKGRQ